MVKSLPPLLLHTPMPSLSAKVHDVASTHAYEYSRGESPRNSAVFCTNAFPGAVVQLDVSVQ